MGAASWYIVVYIALSAKKRSYFCTSIAMAMKGCILILFKSTGVRVDVTILTFSNSSLERLTNKPIFGKPSGSAVFFANTSQPGTTSSTNWETQFLYQSLLLTHQGAAPVETSAGTNCSGNCQRIPRKTSTSTGAKFGEISDFDCCACEAANLLQTSKPR